MKNVGRKGAIIRCGFFEEVRVCVEWECSVCVRYEGEIGAKHVQ